MRRLETLVVYGVMALITRLALSFPPRIRSYGTSSACCLNRFLFSQSEIIYNGTEPTVTIEKDDYRTSHASKILCLRNGDRIRAGVVSDDSNEGMLTDAASIEWIPQGKVKKAEPLANGDPPGLLKIHLRSLKPSSDKLALPAVSLILALPRPLQLGRILPMIAQLGVDRLVLTEARKVPKDYFGSHLFRGKLLTERLIEGLCQAGDARLPRVQVVRHLNNFLSQDLDALFPSSLYARILAHPQRDDAPASPRVRDVQFPNNQSPRLVLAVGPEGGWEEPDEIQLWCSHGFQQITMGDRVLRSDCAVVSLLALAHDACDAAIQANKRDGGQE